MEFLKKKKKILYAGCVFFVIMFLCTLLSKGIYGASLPQVETEKPEKRALGHMVEAEGMVTANREVAVDTVSGLKVNQIYVNLGDSVSANTLLFDVDQEDLKEKISEQELAIKKLEMSCLLYTSVFRKHGWRHLRLPGPTAMIMSMENSWNRMTGWTALCKNR